ncbi:MAG: hypothetical protein SFX74_02585 [Fimbriimonadaceae bacterium]|nr:hypothetical protein [Fimbriimonadaceae bacterium]
MPRFFAMQRKTIVITVALTAIVAATLVRVNQINERTREQSATAEQISDRLQLAGSEMEFGKWLMITFQRVNDGAVLSAGDAQKILNHIYQADDAEREGVLVSLCFSTISEAGGLKEPSQLAAFVQYAERAVDRHLEQRTQEESEIVGILSVLRTADDPRVDRIFQRFSTDQRTGIGMMVSNRARRKAKKS